MPGSPRPSYGQGYARSVGESAYPELWRGLLASFVPVLGPTGTTLFDWGQLRQHATTFTNMDGSNWELSGTLPGYALRFNGTDELVDIGTSHYDAIRDTPNQSNSFIVRFAPDGTNDVTDTIFNYESGSDDTYISMKDQFSDRGLHVRNGGSTDVFAHPFTPVVNQWYHVVMTFNDSDDSLITYLDGIEVDNTDAGVEGLGPVTSGNLGSADGVAHWGGLIAEYYVYNRVLTPAEVRWSYQYLLAPFILRRRVVGFVAAAAAARPKALIAMLHQRRFPRVP